MNKITEIIPDDMPDWANKAMENGQFFRVALDKVKKAEAQKKKCYSFVKQNDFHSCFACCAAMAAGETLQDVIKFVGHTGFGISETSNHPDKVVGFSHAEINRYLASHDISFGVIGVNINSYKTSFVQEFSHFQIEIDIKDKAALIIVKSLNFPGTNVTHCLFWDGKKLFDPHHGEVEYSNYEMLEYWPLFDWKGME